MLIGINGALNSGKDTAFDIIKEFYPQAERISFAEKLKESLALLLNIERATLEELKNNENVVLVWGIPQDSVYDGLYRILGEWRMNGRELLQRYGTEAHRDVFGSDFWVDMALPLATDHEDKILVVTDMRFPNEVARVKELKGQTWKIIRETSSLHKDHASEQNLDDEIDVFVNNTGTIDDLRKVIKEILPVGALA